MTTTPTLPAKRNCDSHESLASARGYVPVFTTHNYHSEGGNKTHIALVESTGVGKVETVVLCGRSLWLPDRGARIDDITQWLSVGEREVCQICARKAKAHNAPHELPATEML